MGEANLSDAHAGTHQSRLRRDIRLRAPCEQTRAGEPPHRFAHRLPEEEWEIVVSGVYPAYISEEQYARNREQLRANMYNFILATRRAA